MPVVHTSVTVGTAVTTVVPSAGDGNYQFIAVANSGPGSVYLKMVPSTVTLTVSNGLPILAGATLIVDQDLTPILVGGVSGIAASGATASVVVQAY